MKQLFLIFLLLLTYNLSSQEKTVKIEPSKKEQKVRMQGNNPEALAKTETKKLTKQLGLSSEQMDKVYEVYLSHFKEELSRKKEIDVKMKVKGSSNKEELKRKISEQKSVTSDKVNTELKGILTTEQYETYLKSNLEGEKRKQKKLKARY